MDKKENIESLIFRYLSDSASDEESKQLLEWLKESRENRISYFAFKEIWLNAHKPGCNKQYVEESLYRLKLRTFLNPANENKHAFRKRINFRRISIAATILVLISISSFLGIKLNNISKYDQALYEIIVPFGARTNVLLPDGTNVWLNAGSTMTYRSDFARNDRSVSLTGEAYFDVKPDNNSLFIVNTRDLNIRVLGTKFNVKSYPDEDVTETTLIDGKVEVLTNDKNVRSQPVSLKPNQRIVYTRSTHIISLEDSKQDPTEKLLAEDKPELPVKPTMLVSNVDNIADYVSWKDGRLTFRSETLEALATKLERYYNVTIIFLDESIKELKYTGTLEEVKIEEVMRAIASASNINYKIEKNKITLSR